MLVLEAHLYFSCHHYPAIPFLTGPLPVWFLPSGGRGDSGTLRSAKSEESLTSLHAVDGKAQSYLHPQEMGIKGGTSTSLAVDIQRGRFSTSPGKAELAN